MHPGLLWETAYLALTPVEAIDLLLGAPAPDPALRPGAVFADGAGAVRIDLVDGEGRLSRRVVYDPQGRLRSFETYDDGGRLRWRAGFDAYALVSGEAFAHALVLEVSAGGARAEILLSDVELNPALPAGIFRLRAPAGAAAAQGG